MKLPALATVAALTATIATSTLAFQAPASGAASFPPCTPKIGKVQGHSAVTNCGPATATLKIGSKTYTFKDGSCSADPAAHMKLQLSLGTLVTSNVKGNAGEPSFQLELITTGSLKIDTLNADFGGKQLVNVIDLTVKGSLTSGSFSSKASPIEGPATSGSWNCHGPIYTI